MSTVERRWLIANFVVGVPFCIALFIFTWRAELEHYTPDGFTVVMGFGGSAIWSFVITLFVFGIPSRIAINLFIKERRTKCWKETIVLFITFAALCWMFYSLFTSPPEG
jgi:hypothetical protein